MVDHQIHAGQIVNTDYTVHVCPLCGNVWLEQSDKDEYPNYCPACGEEYDVNQNPQEGKMDRGWIPAIVRHEETYLCPYCESDSDTLCPGPYCAKCEKYVGETPDFNDDFAYVDGEYVVRHERDDS